MADVLEKFGKVRNANELWRKTKVTLLRKVDGFEVEEQGRDHVRHSYSNRQIQQSS